MKSRRNLRRKLKAITLACSVILITIWAASIWWGVSYVYEGRCGFDIIDGALSLVYSAERVPGTLDGWHTGKSIAIIWRPSWYSYPEDDAWILNLPLWIPSLCIVFPTMILFLLDRRIPKGHCRGCGYDLTGNESGTCPECGTTR
jgi:hypothetical protein